MMGTPVEIQVSWEGEVGKWRTFAVEVKRNEWNGDLQGKVNGRAFNFKSASDEVIAEEIEKAARRLAAWQAIQDAQLDGTL